MTDDDEAVTTTTVASATAGLDAFTTLITGEFDADASTLLVTVAEAVEAVVLDDLVLVLGVLECKGLPWLEVFGGMITIPGKCKYETIRMCYLNFGREH